MAWWPLSRALVERLSAQQSDAQFDAMLIRHSEHLRGIHYLKPNKGVTAGMDGSFDERGNKVRR